MVARKSGLTRFDQFRQSLGIAPTMLTKRLATLTEERLLEKRLYSTRPPREEYVLTQAGRDYLPVLFMIGAWGANTVARASCYVFWMRKPAPSCSRLPSTQLPVQRSARARSAW
ncbi:winged helix-turn-helix transcriptional regulator [Xanthomonas arboricola]|uniref:winged helix-turn-helix transcriptional regulator n=1 Tax=Xanthomonas arboricola TaxID=56448 RepID=UPI001C678FBC|nr:helix-turn-helix domain-containing protein [Xanthomonas arboricola]